MSAAAVWQQTPDRRTWRAARGGVLLSVTKTANGAYRAEVEGPGVTERSPEFRISSKSWSRGRTCLTAPPPRRSRWTSATLTSPRSYARRYPGT
jgi:hypothetical protein